jgi:hypothetical protein
VILSHDATFTDSPAIVACRRQLFPAADDPAAFRESIPGYFKQQLALRDLSCDNLNDHNESTPGPPIQMLKHLLHGLDNVAALTGMPVLPLDPDAVCATALRSAGRSAFIDQSFVDPMQVLFECYDREANLNVAGRYSARWDALRCLANVLRFDAEEESDSTIVAERIERPIFITGLPRSGTTLLHSLLAQDTTLRVPRSQDMIFPYPPRGRDRRFEQVERQLRLFQMLAPQMRALHPLSADGPQECTEITAQVFQSIRYEATHRVPSYQNWLDLSGHLPAYRFHKRFLQHLQHQSPHGRWVLKCPDHIHALNAIETVYPDCGIVFVHRDPVRVAASGMKLTEVIRRPFTRHIDKAEIGRQVLARTQEATDIMVARETSSRHSRVFHLYYSEFASDPIGKIESFYRHFDLEMTPATRQSMRARLAEMPAGKNGYELEEFGLDPADLCERFEAYIDYFGIRREFGPHIAHRQAVAAA